MKLSFYTNALRLQSLITVLPRMQADPFRGKYQNKNNTFNFSDISFLCTSSKLHLLAKANFNPDYFKPIALCWKVLKISEIPKLLKTRVQAHGLACGVIRYKLKS